MSSPLNPRAPQADKTRWLKFCIVMYLLLAPYLYFSQKKAATVAEQQAAQSGVTTSTLAAANPMAVVETPTTETARLVDGSTSVAVAVHPGALSSITTKNYQIEMDQVGAVIHSWKLLDVGTQSQAVDPPTSGIELVRRLPQVVNQPIEQMWPLEIGFKEQGRKAYEDFNDVPWTEKPSAANAPDGRVVTMHSPAISGLRVVKTYEFPTTGFLSRLRVTIHNDNPSTVPITDAEGRGLFLRWGPGLVERGVEELNSGDATYDAAVYHGPEGVEVMRPKLGGDALILEDKIEWAGIESKFLSAVILPEQPAGIPPSQRYYFRTLVPNSYRLDIDRIQDPRQRESLENYEAPLVAELATDQFELAPGSSKSFSFQVYAGPRKHSVLKEHGHNLTALMYPESWWWMRAIYLGLNDLLNGLHKLVLNYGIAIMTLTVIVKLLVLPLVMRSIHIQAKSGAEMKRVKPHLDALNEKYKDDPQTKQRETWKVYQEHGINPLSGMRSCIPMLPQMPIFIGLFTITKDSIDLQGAQFLWINDLSSADRLVSLGMQIPLIGSWFNLLPLVAALTQFGSSKIAMKRALQNISDPTQRQIQEQMVYLIPVIMLVTTYTFPAGLMLYWIASNSWQIVQTLYTNKILDREEDRWLKNPPPRKEKKAKNPNGFMAKMGERMAEAQKEMERRQKAAGTPQVGKNPELPKKKGGKR